MQQILNSQDRNQAFFKFLLFFVITLLLVVTAVYFDFRVPSKENDWLRSQLENRQIQEANQAKFVAKMEEVVALFDSLGKSGANANTDMIFNSINAKIGEMGELQLNDQTMYGRMDKALADKFDELKRAKKELIASNANAGQISALQARLDQCQLQLDGFRRAASQSQSPTQ